MGDVEIRPQGDKIEQLGGVRCPGTPVGCESVFGFKWLLQILYSTLFSNSCCIDRPDQEGSMWTEECGEAFVMLKAALSVGPVLHSPDYGREFVVQTDASDRGMGAVLCQVNENREDSIAYFSRKFLPREERYSTMEECLSVKLGVQAFRVHILRGSSQS